jgi:carbon-monoxide dehydrogenase large subunit
LEASAVDIEFGDGAFRIGGTDRLVDLFAVAEAAKDPANLPTGMSPGLDTTQVQNPTMATFPSGCHIAEVEIDPDSGVTMILRYTVVDDFGAVINPLLLEGQVHGGVAQGIGQALLEETVYDNSGQLSPAPSWTMRCRVQIIFRISHSRPAIPPARPTRSA